MASHEAFGRQCIDFVVTSPAGDYDQYPVPALFLPDGLVTTRAWTAFHALEHHRERVGRDAMIDSQLSFRLPKEVQRDMEYGYEVVGWAGLDTALRTPSREFKRTIPCTSSSVDARSVSPAALYSFFAEVKPVARTFNHGFLTMSPNTVGALPPMLPPEFRTAPLKTPEVAPLQADLPFYSNRIHVMPDEQLLLVDDKSIHIPEIPCKLITYLARRPGTFYQNEKLLQDVWGYPPGIQSKVLGVNIGRLRAKLPPNAIRTITNIGVAVAKYAPDDPQNQAA